MEQVSKQYYETVIESLIARCERNEKVIVTHWHKTSSGASFDIQYGPWCLGKWSLAGNGYIDAAAMNFREMTCDSLTARNIYNAVVEAAPEGTVLLPQEEATVWFTRKD
jgi:hypothetical protein